MNSKIHDVNRQKEFEEEIGGGLTGELKTENSIENGKYSKIH